jgi:hypothetical protein
MLLRAGSPLSRRRDSPGFADCVAGSHSLRASVAVDPSPPPAFTPAAPAARRRPYVHGGMNVCVIVRLGVEGSSPKWTFELSAVTMPSHSSPGGQLFHT